MTPSLPATETNYQKRALVEPEMELLLAVVAGIPPGQPAPQPMHRLRLPVQERARLLLTQQDGRQLTVSSYIGNRPPGWNIGCPECNQRIWQHPIGDNPGQDYRMARLALEHLEHECP